MNKKVTFLVVAFLVVALSAAAIWLAARGNDTASMIAQSFSHQPDWLNLAVECPNSFLAEKLFERAAVERHKQGGPREIRCLDKFAEFCEQQGKNDQAEQLLRQALVLTAGVPETKLSEWLCPNPFVCLGGFLERHGRGDEALALYLQSYNRADVARGELYYADRLPIMYYDKSLGSDNCMKGKEMGFDAEIYFAHRFYPQSIQLCKDALALFEDPKRRKSIGFHMEGVLKCLALSNARLGHLQEARRYYEKLAPLSESSGYGGNALENLQEYAKVCQDLGDTRKARELVKQAEEWKSTCKREGFIATICGARVGYLAYDSRYPHLVQQYVSISSRPSTFTPPNAQVRFGGPSTQ